MNAQQAAAFLREHDRYLVLTHRNPDGDAVGSAAALCRVLRAVGKTAWALDCEENDPPLLRGYLEGYVAPPDFAPETVVSVDLAGEGMLPPHGEEYRGRIQLAIDHHGSNTGYAAQSWVEPESASCGELIFALAEELGGLDRETARLLYVAVSTDTGCFVFNNTTARTHRIAAALMDQGIDTRPLNKAHFRTKSLRRLRLESAMVRDMELYQDGTIVVMSIPQSLQTALGITEADTEGIAGVADQLEGALHAVTVKEKPDGTCRISLRTDARLLNASDVCALLGGGGHPFAAGCSFTGTVDRAVKAVLAAIEQVQNA